MQSPTRSEERTFPGACDTHVHVFGTPDRYPWAPDRTYTPEEASAKSYLALAASLGVDRAVLVQPSVYGTDNRCLLDTLAAWPHQFRGVAVVDAEVDDADLAKMDALGVRGVRLNPRFAGGLQLAEMSAFAARIAPLGWHIQLIIDIAGLPELVPMIKDLPVPVVIDHLGMMPVTNDLQHPAYRALLDLVARGACLVKLSAPYLVSADGPPYHDALPLMRALAETAADQLLWGTNWPHPAFAGPAPDDAALLGLLDAAFEDDQLHRTILVDNPARLYRFAGA